MKYDPLKDEKKEFSLKDWADSAKEEIDSYVKDWEEPDSNDFHRQKHTWSEWMNAFMRYMSW